MDGLETSMGVTRVELEKNKLKTTRAEEALQKLQGDLSTDSPSPSASDITSKEESALAAQVQAAEGAVAGLKEEMEALRSGLGVLRSNVAALGDAHTELTLKSDMDQQVKRMEERFANLERGASSSVKLDLE